MKSSQASSKLERKTVERNRRMHMKGLCFKLASLISSHHSKEAMSQQDQLDVAAVYINNLQEKIQKLRAKKEQAMRVDGINRGFSNGMTLGPRLPIVEVKDLGTCLEVVLISGLYKKFMFCDVISVLEEEGVEVVNASFSVAGDKIYHIIHSRVTSSRVGFESDRVYQRLRELVH